MNLTRDDKIKLWGNSKARHDFLKTHKEWDEWVSVDKLSLVYRKFELSPDKWIVAMTYRYVPGYHFDRESAWSEGVKYYIHKTAHPFLPSPAQEYEITELLKKEKMRLQEEKRAEKK